MGFFGGGGEPKISILNNGTEIGAEGSLNFIAGSNISLDFNADTDNKRIDITIAASGGGGGGSGEVNTASNLGTGSGLYKQKVGDDLQFKSLKAGSSKLSLVSNTNDLTFDVVEANINHENLQNAGTNSHSQIDSHIASTSNPHSVTKTQVGLGNVENTALSTWAGTTNITTLGTIATGSIPMSLITDELPVEQGGTGHTSYTDGQLLIGNSSTNKLSKATLTSGSSKLVITNGNGSISLDIDPTNINHADLIGIGSNSHSQIDSHIASSSNPHGVTKTQIGLGNVENTALSTWNGSSNINTVGTVTTGTWNADTISISKGGTGQTTANAAFNALAPSQTSNSGKFLSTDGTNTNWSDFNVYPTTVRQTILSGSTNANGFPNCLSTGIGLIPKLLATSTPIFISFAKGFDSKGSVDTNAAIITDTDFPTLAANNTHYLYADRNTGTGSITLGNTVIAPQYGSVFDQSGLSINNFNGTNGSTTFTDQYSGITWTTGGSAALSTTSPKFGSACLTCGSNGDYAQTTSVKPTSSKWTLEFWTKFNVTSGNNQILGTPETYSLVIRRNNSTNKLETYLSGTGSGYNISNGAAGTKDNYTSGTYYHIALVFDGSTYKLWVNGALDITVTSSLKLNATGIRLGDSPANTDSSNCSFDAFRFIDGVALYTEAFTPPATTFSEEFHWFDTQKMTMNFGGPTDGWAIKERVFIGEALAGASSISTVTPFAYRGRAVLPVQTVTIRTDYVLNHNVGVPPTYLNTYGSIYLSGQGKMAHVPFASEYYINPTANSGLRITNKDRKTVTVSGLYVYVITDWVAGSPTSIASGDLYMTVERGF